MGDIFISFYVTIHSMTESTLIIIMINQDHA